VEQEEIKKAGPYPNGVTGFYFIGNGKYVPG